MKEQIKEGRREDGKKERRRKWGNIDRNEERKDRKTEKARNGKERR
jgi:hypothetical protein